MIVLVVFALLVCLIVVVLVIVAATSKPAQTIAEVLTSLSAGERQALDSLCRAAGVDPKELRPVYGLDDRVMGDERNRLSIDVEGGRIRGLRLSGRGLTSLPDLGALSELSTLWLDGNRVSQADLSALPKLAHVQLSRNHIASLAGLRLPPSLLRLHLSENDITDVAPLARLTSLTELDLSANRIADLSPLAALTSLAELRLADNQVTTFDALLALPLRTLDLSRNRVAALPAQLPRQATWKVKLEGNPVLEPPGYLRRRSYSISYSGTGGGTVTKKGVIQSGAFEISGTYQQLPALRAVELSTPSMGVSIGNVTLAASVNKGRVRFYLHEPDGMWSSPWITKGLVEGFGLAQVIGWVYADATPGHPVRLVGRLLTGTGQPPQLEFQMEPLDGPAEDITYRVFRE